MAQGGVEQTRETGHRDEIWAFVCIAEDSFLSGTTRDALPRPHRCLTRFPQWDRVYCLVLVPPLPLLAAKS